MTRAIVSTIHFFSSAAGCLATTKTLYSNGDWSPHNHRVHCSSKDDAGESQARLVNGQNRKSQRSSPKVEAHAEVACREREKARGPDARRKCHKASRRKSDRIKRPLARVLWRKGLSHKLELLTWLEGLKFKIRHGSSFSPQLSPRFKRA